MELSNEQKQELKKLIEDDGLALYEDEQNAKQELTELAKVAKGQFGIETKYFKDSVKLLYKATYDEEKEKTKAFNEFYEDLFKE